MVAIFTRRSLLGEPLRIYGDGTQTRDLLYVDGLRQIRVRRARLRCGDRPDPERGDRARTCRVNELAAPIEPDPARIVHVEHIHPQSEIAVLRCDARQARELLGWAPGGLARATASPANAEPGWPDGWPWTPGRMTEATDDHGRNAPSPSTAATPVRTTLPAVRPPADLGRGRRGGRRRAPLRLADDRPARPGLRSRVSPSATGARHAVAFSSGHGGPPWRARRRPASDRATRR